MLKFPQNCVYSIYIISKYNMMNTNWNSSPFAKAAYRDYIKLWLKCELSTKKLASLTVCGPVLTIEELAENQDKAIQLKKSMAYVLEKLEAWTCERTTANWRKFRDRSKKVNLSGKVCKNARRPISFYRSGGLSPSASFCSLVQIK